MYMIWTCSVAKARKNCKMIRLVITRNELLKELMEKVDDISSTPLKGAPRRRGRALKAVIELP